MKQMPLLDKNGEVRELTAKDFALARPIAKVMSPEFMAMINEYMKKRKNTQSKK